MTVTGTCIEISVNTDLLVSEGVSLVEDYFVIKAYAADVNSAAYDEAEYFGIFQFSE